MLKIIIFLSAFILCAKDSNVPLEVEQTISQALNGKWVFQNFEQTKLSMGSDSSTALSDIKAGEPFQIYQINQLDFEESSNDVPIDSLLKPGEWYVPLYANGKLMQTVMLVGTHFGEKSKYSAGTRSLGDLVKVWEKIKKTWSENKGYNPRLVWIQEPLENSLCFYIPEKGSHNLTIIGKLYLEFTPLSEDLKVSELMSSEETFRSIKAQISERHRLSDSLWAEKTRVNDSLANLRELGTEHLWKKYEKKEPAIPESAVISWWNNMLVQADESIIPQNMSKKELKARRPDHFTPISKRLFMGDDEGITIDTQIIKSAQPLRVGAKPIDKTISKERDDWYVLFAQDRTGYIRIGSTGPLLLVDGPFKDGQKWGLGGSRSSFDAPEQGADLVEISELSPVEFAIRWRVEKAFLRIHTENTTPIHYRISFVSEMPWTRTGSPYGPGVIANDYIIAIATGNTDELYKMTRSRFSDQQVTKLREKLFGVEETINISAEHRKPDALEVNAEGKLHVQHPIVSSINSQGDRKGWAFEIICMERDGLWLVADAYRDPVLSEKQIDEIVDHDLKELMEGRLQ